MNRSRFILAIAVSICLLAALPAFRRFKRACGGGAAANQTSLSGVVSVAVSGNVAYTTAYWPGQLTAVDISNPASPTVLGATPPARRRWRRVQRQIAGNYAFVAPRTATRACRTMTTAAAMRSPSSTSRIRARPWWWGRYTAAPSCSAAMASRSLATMPTSRIRASWSTQPEHARRSTGGLTVIDITNPAGPAIVANLDNRARAPAQTNDVDHSTSVAIRGTTPT